MRQPSSTSARPLRIVSADKAGRMISDQNAKAIQQSIKDLRALLTKAGIDDAAVETQVKEFAEKCGYEVDSYPMPESAYPAAKPYGGATTFAEVQAYHDAQEASEDLSELTWKFQSIYQNIMADEDMTPVERAAAITQAAADFATAAQDPEAADTDEGKKSVGLWAGIKALVTGGTISPPVKTGGIEAPPPGSTVETSKAITLDSTPEPGAFASFKDAKGDWRWMATWSNNFYDRDGEVFTDAAHKEYEAYVDRTHDYPELQLWHIPGSKCGKADMIAYDDGMMLATGTWDEDKADIAAAFARESKDLGVSHGYTYAPQDVVRGAYQHYRTFEISPLPGKKAANIGTNFAAFAAKEEAPMVTDEKRAWLVEKLGPERAKAIEENHLRMKKDLSDRGISFKEFVEAVGDAEDAPAAKVEAPKVEAPAAAPAAEKAATESEVIFAPGFKSVDGGATWTALSEEDAAKAFGGKKAPPFKKGGSDSGDPASDDDEPPKGAKKEAAEAAAPDLMGALVKAVKEANEPLAEEMKAMRAEFGTKIEAIKTGRDDLIAQAWSNDQWGRSVKSATESSDNVIEDAEATKAALDKLHGDQSSGDPALPYVKDLMSLITSGAGVQG